jgi:hypothetical protein
VALYWTAVEWATVLSAAFAALAALAACAAVILSLVAQRNAQKPNVSAGFLHRPSGPHSVRFANAGPGLAVSLAFLGVEGGTKYGGIVGKGFLHAGAEEEVGIGHVTTTGTGMRLGELLALRWSDVEWRNRRLWVRRSITRKGTVQEPKTRGSVRAIAITPTLLSALREHRMRSAYKADGALIFSTAKGTPLDGVNLVRREFKPALRKAKLPDIRFHDLRHGFASLLIAQGEHPKLISEQLGHSSVKITMDRYGHLMDQSYGDASARLDATLFGVEIEVQADGGSII